ncbi:type VI secretion system ATPase TssH [Pantoea sp. JK]|uniref:type VI secretion system ATPase TssH n=1 Tax=Pantoea sp. JK TaxID=2871703 RepID=UPI002238346B|nr:type VI secretion system ATPase TssH [Pantoea sp. JK]MCW6030444.1 type VI secretion system ATPase TssH [Pantoea sp. JK]
MQSNLKNIVQLLTPAARKSLDNAIAQAVARTHHEIEVEHLIVALISDHSELLHSLVLESGLAADSLLINARSSLDHCRSGNTRGPVFSPTLVNFLEATWLHASVNWLQPVISPAALLAGMLQQRSTFIPSLQQALDCDVNVADAWLCQQTPEVADNCNRDKVESNSALAKFTHHLTEQARQGKLDPVLGREHEIRQMIDVLLRRRQNNPVLTGEPGVGKTALAEGLAQRVISGAVPPALLTTEIFTLDMGLLQAGASVKGEFEQRLQNLLKEIQRYPQPIILFIDEAHTLIGAGGSAGQNDAANLLKPALARGELRVVAATTWAEYKKYFEKDAALARRFQVVGVAEPDEEAAIAMLRAMAPMMAHHHQVTIQQQALTAAVRLSSRYIAGRQLPDKAVSLLDTACARVAVSQSHQPKEIEDLHVLLNNLQTEQLGLQAEGGHEIRLAWIAEREAALLTDLARLEPQWHQQQALVQQIHQCDDAQQRLALRAQLKSAQQQQALVFDCVDEVCIADVLAGWTGIPLGRMLEKRAEQADELLPRLQQRVIGQDEALAAIAQQVRIAQAGINDPHKPTGVFMLAGPSGVGKTETALALAELVCGGERGLITINMSEYQEAHSVSGLKGSPPGYVGYGQGGVLTEAVRRQPYSVVLLDEVEKAHPDVMELFYQVFDKGWMEDAEGQRINFRNTLIILTSNLASEKLINGCEKDMVSLSELIRPDFDRVFRPALMGRMQLIPYRPLLSSTLHQIIRLKLDKLVARLALTQSQHVLRYSNSVVTLLAESCQTAQSGARDIDAAINRLVMPLLADTLLGSAGDMAKVLNLSVMKGRLAWVKKRNKEQA